MYTTHLMPKTSKKYFDNSLKEKAWTLFWRKAEKAHPRARLADHLGSFFTEGEITMLEKRLITLYLLNQGASLRETSEKTGLTKKIVIAIKHGFKKPTPRPAGKTFLPEKRPRRFKENAYPTYRLGDSFSRNLRGKR